MFDMTKVEVKKLSYQLAKEFSEMEACPRDREFKQSRADELLKRFEAGEFRSAVWAKAYVEETKKWYRVNGKHTSKMFAQMNGQLSKGNPVHVLLEEYRCPTMEDLSNLYASFDNRLSSRSQSDVNRIYAGSNESLEELSSSMVNLVIGALSFSKWEESATGITPEDRAKLICEHPGFGIWANKLANGSETWFRRVPVFAAAFETYKKNRSEAMEFLASVRDRTGSNVRDPSRRLSEYLMKTSIGSGRGAVTGKQMAGRREMFVKCLHAWNAHRSGTTTELKYHAGSKTPVAK